MKSVHIILPGRIPSKKNSKVFNVKMKRLFSSKNHREWENSALTHLMSTGHRLLIENIKSITMVFNFPDMRRTDLTNKAESVMDLLVKAGIIKDDCWQEVPTLELSGGRIPGFVAGCDVTIRWGE